jgi:hypothetical protein
VPAPLAELTAPLPVLPPAPIPSIPAPLAELTAPPPVLPPAPIPSMPVPLAELTAPPPDPSSRPTKAAAVATPSRSETARQSGADGRKTSAASLNRLFFLCVSTYGTVNTIHRCQDPPHADPRH